MSNTHTTMHHTATHVTDAAAITQVLTRGVAQVLPDAKTLTTLMQKKRIRLYLGIDPTGSLLTLGHSVVLRKLQQFAELGHEVILLIGNGTVKIGDPTGRDSTRPELSDEQIAANFVNWKKQASTILDFNLIEIRHNGDWLEKLAYTDLIKLLAKTTVQQLIERDMFQERIKNELPIYGHEILYPLLQGYDSVVMDVDLEIGGTDQTFNMLMGRTLQKIDNQKEKWVLTTPLINGTDGRKMSKSYGNFIALTEKPNDMYGKLMSVSDELIVEYFTLLTDVPLEEISQIEQAMKKGENPMEFKKQLAKTITAFYHTPELAQSAEHHFERTVQGEGLPKNMPEVALAAGDSVLDLLKSALPQESSGNLRRLIDGSAVSILDATGKELLKPTDPHQQLAPLTIHQQNGDTLVLKVGKRRYFTLV